MTLFYITATALVVMALAVLLRPWWLPRFVGRADETQAMRELNAAIYRDQLKELEGECRIGQLGEVEYREAREELQRRLLEDTRFVEPEAKTGGGRKTWIALLLLLPLGGAGLYGFLGKPEAMLSAEQQDRRAAQNMEKVTADLARKLESAPNNPEGWVMLARSYATMERWSEAEQAIARIGPSLDTNPKLLTAVADLLLRKADGDFSGRPRELIAKALALAPEDEMALYLAGADALDQKNWKTVVVYWEPLLKQLEPEGEDARMIAAGLERAREELRAAAAHQKLGAGKAAQARQISGRLELAASLKASLKPDDVVFLFARPEGASGMPLAALRLRASDLPLDFTLDDRHALGEARLSTAKAVRIEARIPKSSTAKSSPGDLAGRSGVVKPGARGVRVLIDTVL